MIGAIRQWSARMWARRYWPKVGAAAGVAHVRRQWRPPGRNTTWHAPIRRTEWES